MTKDKSSRAKGDAVEDKALEVLGSYFSKTAGSGSVHKDQDIRSKNFIGEVKLRPTAGLSIAGKDLKKLIERAKLEGKDWMAICENYDGLITVSVDVRVFSYMLEEMLISEALADRNNELYTELLELVRETKGKKVVEE